jgi:thiamine phosphate synthase YjbQ (UPF0047 family)
MNAALIASNVTQPIDHTNATLGNWQQVHEMATRDNCIDIVFKMN